MNKENENDTLNREKEYQARKEEVGREQTKLLSQIRKRQDRGLKVSKVIAVAECGLLGVLVVVFILLVPMFLKTVHRVEETMDAVDVLVEHAETSLTEVTELARDADKLVNENSEAIAVAIDNFNKVDFDSLNRSISNLAKIMEPIVEIVQILKK